MGVCCGSEWPSTNYCTHSYNKQIIVMFFLVLLFVQVDQMLRGAPVDSAGNFDYVAFTRILKHGTKDE